MKRFWIVGLLLLPGCGFLRTHPEIVESASDVGSSIIGSVTGLPPAIIDTAILTVLGVFGIKKGKNFVDARMAKKNGESPKG